MRFRGDTFKQRCREPGFADTGFSREQHHLSLAVLGSGPAPQQEFKFFFPTNERGEAARMQCLEAALDRSWSQRSRGAHRPYDAFEVLSPRSSSSNRLPSSFRVLSAITTVFGSAVPCKRAARFGVSPTMACS